MKKIYIKEPVCIGCTLCEVYCKQAHSKSKNLIKAFKREEPRPISRVRMEGKDHVSFSIRCQHCDDAPCVYSCLSGALSKDMETGVVTVDTERCIGCWTCVLACPFGAITRDEINHKAIKCDLCPEEDEPACVANCPNEALVLVDSGKIVNAWQ